MKMLQPPLSGGSFAGASRDDHAPFQRLIVEVESHAPQQVSGYLQFGMQRRDRRRRQHDHLLALVASSGQLLLDILEVGAALHYLDTGIGRHRRSLREQAGAGAV